MIVGEVLFLKANQERVTDQVCRVGTWASVSLHAWVSKGVDQAALAAGLVNRVLLVPLHYGTLVKLTSSQACAQMLPVNRASSTPSDQRVRAIFAGRLSGHSDEGKP